MTGRINKAELDLLQGRLEEGRGELDRAEALIEQMGLDYARSYLEMHRARFAVAARELEEAQRWAQSALEKARASKEANATNLCLGLLGDILRQRGQWSQAQTHLQEAEDNLRGSGARLSLAKALCWRALLEADQGHEARAVALVQEIQELSRQMQAGARSTVGRLLEAARRSL
jgi:tetratricopeptide (TPR) repeat protein